jgi:hypothetical protein
LIVWAEQGRILPGHEVSSDRKKWVQAVSLELLDMRWYVDDGDGELRGPLNRLAAEALIKSGKVAEKAQLVSADEIEADVEAEQRRTRAPEAPKDGQPGSLARPDAHALAAAQQEREKLAALLKEAEAQKEAALRNAESEARAHERRQEQLRGQVKKLEQQIEETAAGERRNSELEQALQFHEQKTVETAQILAAREAELESVRAELEAGRLRLEETAARADAEAAARLKAEARVQACEEELTELLNGANARDIQYQEKIAELEKQCAQPPEVTARFFTDQAAVYELINAEVAELAAVLEHEKAQSEQFKAWNVQRQQALQERRQKLLKHLGGSPGEMTRRAVREQPSDPLVARLRAEVENLRVTYQHEVRLAETKEREWQERMRLQEAEELRLRAQVAADEKKVQRVQDVEDLLGRRERELASERKNREDEREQFGASQRALLMRIEALERVAKPSTPEEIQASEARNVKLASWMRLKH